MEIKLTDREKQELERHHKKERDGRIKDRLKAVLLHNEGWSQVNIAQALRIRPETVQDHLRDYKGSKKIKPENGGSESYLNLSQTEELIVHLEENTHTKIEDICAYVREKYRVSFTIQGMTSWMNRHEFSYKKPKGTPAKADLEKQAAFKAYYEKLVMTRPEDEPILFGDGVHPTMATKISYGWIRTGKDKPIATTGSRTRVNLMGSLDLETMKAHVCSYETLDSDAMASYFEVLREQYPKPLKIHLILDQGSYNKSEQTRNEAKKRGIVLHFLPPYSPNLNPIERLWKVMNECVRNNRFFKTAKEFRESITEFFDVIWPRIAMSMVDRINDNFQTLKQAS